MRTNPTAIAVATVGTLLASASWAGAESSTFKVDSTGGSSMQFVSDAPLEKFTGRTTKLSGELRLDPNKLADAKGEVRVKTDSIKTNIELRDEHLAGEGWLDAKRYPEATFVISKVSGAESLKANDLTQVSVTGKFTLHGVSKEITTPARVRYTPSPASVRVQSTFTVHLEDYKIEIPKIVSYKVSPDIVVNIDLKANS